jgi:hypothetical protein
VSVDDTLERLQRENAELRGRLAAVEKKVAQFDALQSGTLEMAVFPMSYAVGKVPEVSITIMPGTITSMDQAMRLKGTPFHKKLQEVMEKAGTHIVTWWWTPGGFASKDKPIGGPDTVKGEKMRAADPTFETMLKAAGASVINIPSTEIYPSLQSGVLSSTLTSAETFVSMRIYEQTKFATVGGDYWQYREKEHRLRGESTNRELRFGDHVVVEVKSIDEDRHQIEFRLHEVAGTPIARRAG